MKVSSLKKCLKRLLIITIIFSILYAAILYVIAQGDPTSFAATPLVSIWLSSTVVFYISLKCFHLFMSKSEKLNTSPVQYHMARLGSSGGIALFIGAFIGGVIGTALGF